MKCRRKVATHLLFLPEGKTVKKLPCLTGLSLLSACVDPVFWNRIVTVQNCNIAAA